MLVPGLARVMKSMRNGRFIMAAATAVEGKGERTA